MPRNLPSPFPSLVHVRKSPSRRHKWRATWTNGKHTDFGATGYSDYTLHRDSKRRALYRIRHAKDHIRDPVSAGALSWHLLWGESTDMKANIASFRKEFRV